MKKNSANFSTSIYRVRYIDKRTKNVKEIDVSAQSKSGAKNSTLKFGSVIKVTSLSKWFSVGVELSSSDRYIFLTRLSTMVSSKVGISESLRLMRDTFTGKIRKVSAEMGMKISQGMDMSQSMEALGPGAFPPAIIALVKAGSLGGDTGKALMDAADFEQELDDIKKESSKGMMSAILGFIVAGIFLIGSSFYLSPQVKDSPIFRDSPVDTRIFDLLADITGWLMILVMVLFFILLLLGSVLKRFMPRFSDAIIMRIPFYRDLVMAKNSYVTLYGLSILVGSGVNTETSLRITMENAPRGALREDVKSALKAIRQGNTKWPMVMKTLHATDRAALMTSSDREQVSKTLSNLSNQHRRLYGERLKLTIPTMQMVSAMLLTLAGTIMFGQIILPMIKMTENLI